jgi:hypothetical protein
MSDLYACPFCRQLFTKGEVKVCPECDLEVKPLAELPPSHEAQLLDPADGGLPPEDEVKDWFYSGRGRGALTMVALVGIAVFFAPWLHESAPEIRTWSGFEFARQLAWIWAGGLGWFIMLPLVVSRRTIRQMRGARVAVAFLAAMVLLTVAVRIAITPTPHPLIPVRYRWGWGMYAAGFLSLLALALAARFGGSLEDMETSQHRPRDETVH